MSSPVVYQVQLHSKHLEDERKGAGFVSMSSILSLHSLLQRCVLGFMVVLYIDPRHLISVYLIPRPPRLRLRVLTKKTLRVAACVVALRMPPVLRMRIAGAGNTQKLTEPSQLTGQFLHAMVVAMVVKPSQLQRRNMGDVGAQCNLMLASPLRPLKRLKTSVHDTSVEPHAEVVYPAAKTNERPASIFSVI